MHRLVVIALLMVCAVPAAAVAQVPAIALSIRDHQFVPAEVAVPTGAKVELIVRNEQAVPAEFESTSLHREKIVTAGSAVSVYVGPLDPGRYEFFDDFYPASRGFVVVR